LAEDTGLVVGLPHQFFDFVAGAVLAVALALIAGQRPPAIGAVHGKLLGWWWGKGAFYEPLGVKFNSRFVGPRRLARTVYV
jgi:hypothetical protein